MGLRVAMEVNLQFEESHLYILITVPIHEWNW
jgi:hypothetical protein